MGSEGVEVGLAKKYGGEDASNGVVVDETDGDGDSASGALVFGDEEEAESGGERSVGFFESEGEKEKDPHGRPAFGVKKINGKGEGDEAEEFGVEVGDEAVLEAEKKSEGDGDGESHEAV